MNASAKSDIPLNSIFLKNRVAELGLKQWWLAEQVGVDRKTVIRWIQGQVKSIQLENAKALTEILQCSLDDLNLSSEMNLTATSEDQKKAATLLASSSLIEKLGPIGEWNVIESLLKATVVPDLPLNILGEIYDKLTIASWRQSKIDQAASYNLKAEQIALKTDDKVLLGSVLISKANIFSWRGQIAQSIQTYKDVLKLEKYLSSKARGSTHSNLGGVLYEGGDLTAGELEIKKSISIFNVDGKAINLSIAHTHLALIYLQQNKIEQAAEEIKILNHYATLDDYRRGLHFGKLLLAEVEAIRGNKVEALLLVQLGLEEFAKMNIIEGLNFEIAGRVFRILEDFNQAQNLVQKGISISAEFPIYQAALYVELAEIFKAKKASQVTQAANQAIALYEKHQCPLRVEIVKKRFDIR